jgi:hypothetical protein
MSFESPISVLQNLAGEEVAVVSGSALNNGEQPGVAILAKDESGNAQFLNMNASGELKVQASVDVDLDYTTDSITVYGSDGAALVQDAEDSYLLVRDNDAKSAIDAAKSAITGSVEAFQAAFEAEDFASETTLAAFKADNRSDLQAVSGAVDVMNSNLGGKLDTLDSSVGAVETAVDSASSAISGSVVALGSDLGSKLDTIDASVGAVETAVDSASSAISGSVVALGADIGGKLDTLNAVDFATEATLDAFKSANHSDLGALSSSLDRFTFNGSNELLVNATVDVDLDYTTDSIKVYGSQDAALVQDAADDYLLVRDNDAKNAIDGAKSAITGSISTMDSNLGGKLDTIDASVGDVETAVNNASSAISGSVVALGADLGSKFDTLNAVDFATETTLAAFKADNRSDLQAVSGAIDAFRADFIAEDFASETTLAAFKSDNRSDLQAVSGAIDAMKVELEATLTSIDGKDFATEATLGAFKIENNSNLIDLSSSLDRFTFNGSNELLVNAAVDVELNYATDSITIYGDEAVPFAQISGSGEMITVPLGSEGNSLLQAASGSIHSDVNGNGALLVGLLGSNSKNVLQSSANDILLVSGAGDFNVVATDLDIRPLTSADVVTVDNMVDVSLLATEATLSAVSGAIDGLGASVDAVKAAVEAIDAAQLGTVTVSASDLDIRDLNSGTDSVSAVQSGDWIVRKHATSAAVSTASASTSDAEVLAANADRMGATFFMDGNATCYIKLGGAASSSDFSVRLVNNGYYELPEGFTGAIHAAFSITDAGIKLRITELSYA